MKRTAFALLSLVLLAGCSDDPAKAGSEGFTVSFTPATLVGEVGGGGVAFTISVIDKATGSAVPSGSVVTVLEQACFDGSDGLGIFDNQDPATADCGRVSKTILSNTGSVTATFHCQSVGTAILLAQPAADPASGGSAPIDCQAGPDGNWSITDINVTDGDLISGGQAVEISAVVLTSDGSPSGSGTSLVASIVSGDSLAFATSSANRQKTDGQGIAKFNLKTTEKTGETVLRIAFQDERRGQPTDRALRVRSAADPNETQLVVTVRHEQLVVTGAGITVLADGEDKLAIEARIEPSPTAQFLVEGQPVTLEIIEGPGFFETEGTRMISPITDADGLVATEFFGGAAAGTTVIEVSAVDPDPDGMGNELVEQVTVNVKALGFIEYGGIEPEVLFVRGSGQNETGTATFRVLDTDRKPLVGVPVRFTLENAPARVTASPARISSDEQGYARTTVQSGTGVGAFSITATATLGEVSISAPSAAIPLVGAKPSRRAFQLQCEYRNVGGLRDRQGDRIVVNSQWPCTSLLLDRFGNPVGVPQTVTFASEGGNIISPQTSRLWDFRANPQSPPDDVGRVGAPYSPLGDPPCDTDPVDGEPFLLPHEDDASCDVQLTNCAAIEEDQCTFNPRDGLVTILAVTTGEEEFSDNNSDGVYTEGEPFWDLGEPYVDTNDNNRRDPGEFFIDLAMGEEEGNGVYDGPDGRWNSQTSIWTSTHVLLTEQPTDGVRFVRGELPGRRQSADGPVVFFADGQIRANYTYTLAEPNATAAMVWQDGFLNHPNASCTYSAMLGDNSDGWDLEVLNPDPAIDQYGFPVEFRSEAAGAGRNEYRTRVRFPVEDPAPYYLTGRRFGVTVSVDVEDEGAASQVLVDFSRRCQISPGSGGVVVTTRTAVLRAPQQ